MFRIIKSAPIKEVDEVLSLRQPVFSLPVQEEAEEALHPEQLLDMARVQADELISQAQAQARLIIQRAEEEARIQATALKEQARQEGWNEGWQEAMGVAEGEAEGIREQARQILNQAHLLHRDTVSRMEGEILDLALDIARRVVMTQLSVEPRTIMEIAREAVELVKNRPLVNIYVNEADMEFVEAGRHQLLHVLPGKVELNILTDNKIQPGGCRIETEQGQVDATLETRWQEVIKVLYGQEE